MFLSWLRDLAKFRRFLKVAKTSKNSEFDPSLGKPATMMDRGSRVNPRQTEGKKRDHETSRNFRESLVTHPRFFYQSIRNELLEKCQPTTVAELDPWKWTRSVGRRNGVLLQRTWSQWKQEQREELRRGTLWKSVCEAWNKNSWKNFRRILTESAFQTRILGLVKREIHAFSSGERPVLSIFWLPRLTYKSRDSECILQSF